MIGYVSFGNICPYVICIQMTDLISGIYFKIIDPGGNRNPGVQIELQGEGR